MHSHLKTVSVVFFSLQLLEFFAGTTLDIKLN